VQGDSPPREGQGDVEGGRRCALEPAGPGVTGKRGANDWQGMKQLTSPTMPASNRNRPALPAFQDIRSDDTETGGRDAPDQKTKS
jgi:hypothetical protein